MSLSVIFVRMRQIEVVLVVPVRSYHSLVILNFEVLPDPLAYIVLYYQGQPLYL